MNPHVTLCPEIYVPREGNYVALSWSPNDRIDESPYVLNSARGMVVELKPTGYCLIVYLETGVD